MASGRATTPPRVICPHTPHISNHEPSDRQAAAVPEPAAVRKGQSWAGQDFRRRHPDGRMALTPYLASAPPTRTRLYPGGRPPAPCRISKAFPERKDHFPRVRAAILRLILPALADRPAARFSPIQGDLTRVTYVCAGSTAALTCRKRA